KQHHTCEFRRCLIVDKHGVLSCKCSAPFPLSEDATVDENGQWRMVRLYEYLNGWIPALAVCGRCNHDGKLLTNGEETRNIGYYIFNYALKKQGKNFNLSAIFAKGRAYHEENNQYRDSLQESQRLLLFRLCHAVNREQELAAPMVISYLMGWDDIYRSHHYTAIYWSSFMGALFKAFPDLQQVNQDNAGISQIEERLALKYTFRTCN
ncbi:hypothetical protein F5051DRAFT_341918, partial [Lentinula edodes]